MKMHILISIGVILAVFLVNSLVSAADACTLVCAKGLYADYARCTCLPIRNSRESYNTGSNPRVSSERSEHKKIASDETGSSSGGRAGCFLKCSDHLYADYDKCTCFPRTK